MSLEDRLVEALHRTDQVQPGVDLFARISRSIDEDRKFRKRVGMTAASVTFGLALLAAASASVSRPHPGGGVIWPKWWLQVLMVSVLVPVLLALAPAIRRYGKPFIDDAFHMSPATGYRFARLLDIAYYLAFGGLILGFVDVTAATSMVTVGDDVFIDTVAKIAIFLLVLGVAHTLNLLVMPVVGLVFSSSVRRTRRRLAGTNAPPANDAARIADRTVLVIIGVVIVVTLIAAVGLIVIVMGV